MNKSNLDDIIERHKAQPVGHGYIDIIVARDNFKDFVVDLVNNGYKVESISWWEWCPDGKKNEYGLGGPQSIHYNGWFSELSIQVDDIDFEKSKDNEKQIEDIVQKIEARIISFGDKVVTFKQDKWLTPAIWLDVPHDWRNKYYA